MPKYRINETSFIDNRLVKEGDEIDTDATPGSHWEPLDKPATKAKAEADAAEAEHQAEIRKRNDIAVAAKLALVAAGAAPGATDLV